jgi:hypothetical protein
MNHDNTDNDAVLFSASSDGLLMSCTILTGAHFMRLPAEEQKIFIAELPDDY